MTTAPEAHALCTLPHQWTTELETKLLCPFIPITCSNTASKEEAVGDGG